MIYLLGLLFLGMALGLWVPARYKKASWMVGAAVALVVLYFYLSPYHM